MKQSIKPYAFGMIRLRLITKADLPSTRDWRNVARRWFVDSRIITEDGHMSWYQHYSEKSDDYVFIVELNDVGYEKLGQVAIYNIDLVRKSAEVGRFLVNPDHSGKNYMKTACAGIIKFAFDILGLEYLYLEVYQNNEIARHIYHSCGFEIEPEQKGKDPDLLKMAIRKN